jgi:hypothetical protein
MAGPASAFSLIQAGAAGRPSEFRWRMTNAAQRPSVGRGPIHWQQWSRLSADPRSVRCLFVRLPTASDPGVAHARRYLQLRVALQRVRLSHRGNCRLIGKSLRRMGERGTARLSTVPPSTVPPETIIAGLSFQDKASFHRVSRNGSATEPMRLVIAYTVKVGEPNTTWPRNSGGNVQRCATRKIDAAGTSLSCMPACSSA